MVIGTILDDAIGRLQPEDLPSEYIVLAKLVDTDGVERILRGDAITTFLNDPNRGHGLLEARVILDMSKIRAVMMQALACFFDELHRNTLLKWPPEAAARPF